MQNWPLSISMPRSLTRLASRPSCCCSSRCSSSCWRKRWIRSSIANFRRNWLNDRIAAAQVAALVLEAHQKSMLEGSETGC